MQPSEPAGVIHDIGYQRYTGERLGRGYAVRSLYTHGFRTAFGLGRTGKSKLFPWFVVGIMTLIAAVSIVIRSETGRVVIPYMNFPRTVIIPLLVFVAASAPELVSRDLQSKVLSLYLARPLTRTDYVVAKLGAFVSAIFALLAVPMLLMFVDGAFSVDGVSAIGHEFNDFLGGLGVAAIYAIAYGTIALLIAALLPRRMAAAAVIAGYVLVTSAVGLALGQIIGGNLGKSVGQMISPPTMVEGLKEWIYHVHFTNTEGYGLAFLAVSVGVVLVSTSLLLLRYRKVSI